MPALPRDLTKGRAGVVVAGGLGAAVCLRAALLIVQHAGRPGYDLGAGLVALGLAAAVGAVVGWGIVAWRRDGALLLSVIAAGCLVAGVAAILSVGIVLLAAGVVLAVRVAQSIPLRPADRPLPVRPLAAAVVLAGLGTLLAAFVAAKQPIVDCTGQGASSGHETTDGRTYTWRCEDGRLVEFHRS